MTRSGRSVADAEASLASRIPRSMDGLARLGGWVDDVVSQLHLNPTAEYALRLCVEEAVANVVMHGTALPERDSGEVALRVAADADEVRVTIEDACAPFDPLHVAPPQRPANLADAREGGLGVHLMRQYARMIGYEYVNGRNKLTLTIARAG
jgi:serine/threonine-protein kinase RsbW